MKIVHISPKTPGRNAIGGGLVFMWQNIKALAELGHEVHLVIAEPHAPLDQDLQQMVTSVTYCTPLRPSRYSLEGLVARVFRPETMMFRFPDWRGLASQCTAAIQRLEPDLVWADWIGSLVWARSEVPTVYGHLDFIHMLQDVRLRAHGRVRRPDILSTARLRDLELELVQRASHVASVSATDVALFESRGIPCTYMPVVGQDIPRPRAEPPKKARAFLLGRSNTAMNMSRRNLMEGIWPELGNDHQLLEWHQVGEVPTNDTDAWRRVAERFQIHGYVENLGTLLLPTDLCLVPYRTSTGFRAKFVTAAGYGMVNIGYRETFAVAREFVPGENCLAAEDDAEFAGLLVQYAGNSALRTQLAAASRHLYEEAFGFEARLPSYRSMLRAALAHG